MARNGSGAYSVSVTHVSGSTITAAALNSNATDAGSEITNSLALDGQSTMTGQFKAANGIVGAPGMTFGADLDTGLYRIGADNIGLAVGGVKVVDYSATGVSVTGAHSVSGTQTVAGLSSGLGHVPVGSVVDFAGTSAPTGWLFCYGQSLLRADYAALFTAIGTTFGAADGTHFTIPDYRGRVAAGKDDMGGSSANRLTGLTNGVNGDNLGDAGGEEAHTLTQAQLPSVNFTVSGITLNDPGHSHTFQTNATIARGGSDKCADTTIPTGTDNTSNVTTGITISSQGSAASGGSGTALNVVQPTIILNKIIFAGV